MCRPTSQALVFEGIQIQIFALANVLNWDLDSYFKQSRISDVPIFTIWIWAEYSFTGAISELKHKSTKHYQNQLSGGYVNSFHE